MRKFIIGLAAFAALIAVALLAFSAVRLPVEAGPSGPAGKSNMAHLYLYEKDPTNWTIVEEGAWGKMTYNQSGEMFDFVFNGHGLEAGLDYTLIYYPDPWPGRGLVCLGSDVANGGGNVHIAEEVELGDIPTMNDLNYPEGAKIWLVLTRDVFCENRYMGGWDPTEYLFEETLITFDAL